MNLSSYENPQEPDPRALRIVNKQKGRQVAGDLVKFGSAFTPAFQQNGIVATAEAKKIVHDLQRKAPDLSEGVPHPLREGQGGGGRAGQGGQGPHDLQPRGVRLLGRKQPASRLRADLG